MMRNDNTGEMTSYIEPDNYNIAANDLNIDNSKFNPNACVFSLMAEFTGHSSRLHQTKSS